MLRPDTNDIHLNIFVSQLLFILSTEESEGKEWEEHVNTVVELATHFPRRDLSLICLTIEVIGSSMEPVSIRVDIKLSKVSEFVHRMVLEVVVLNLVIFPWWCFVFKTSRVSDS